MFESPIPENDQGRQDFIVKSADAEVYRSTSDCRSPVESGSTRGA